MAVVIPAILTNDEDDYRKKLRMAEHVAEIIQVDIIDGKFARNSTIDTTIVKKYFCASQLEIQLMVLHPKSYVDELIFIDHVRRIIVPLETKEELPETIYRIKNRNKQVGLSINPSTLLKAVIDFLNDIDLLVILAVEPGFSGQKFQVKVIEKIKEVKRLAPGLAVEVDGGINFDNVKKVASTGLDFLAVNSALFRSSDFYVAYEKLAKLAANP